MEVKVVLHSWALGPALAPDTQWSNATVSIQDLRAAVSLQELC